MSFRHPHLFEAALEEILEAEMSAVLGAECLHVSEFFTLCAAGAKRDPPNALSRRLFRVGAHDSCM